MKKGKGSFFVGLALIFSLVSPSSGAVVITDFGTSSFSVQTFGNDFTVSSQGANSIDINGNASNQLSGSLLNVPPSIAAFVTIEVEGVFSMGTGGFSVTLFDSNFNQSVYSGGSWDDLVALGNSSLVFQSSDPAMDFADVSGVQIAGSGAPANTVTGTLTNLEAVPEPSTFAFFAGLLGLGVVFCRRRRG